MNKLEFKLEKHLLDDWDLCKDQNALDCANELSNEGVSTGIAFYNDGYYVLVTAGQGPIIVYPEGLYNNQLRG